MSPPAVGKDLAAYSAFPIIVIVVVVKSRPSHWHLALVGGEGCEGRRHMHLELCAEKDWQGGAANKPSVAALENWPLFAFLLTAASWLPLKR